MENMNHSGGGTFVAKKNNKINVLAFIGCLVLAFTIWIYVMNVKISDNSKTFTIKLDIRGESELLNEKNYSIFGGAETWVKVTVQGALADLNKCSEKDFGVYIDVSDIEKSGMTPLNIVVENQRASVAVVSTDPVQINVFADEKVNEKEVPIFAEFDVEQIGSDKFVRLSSDVIRVSGPKTYVNEISYAKIVINSLEVAGVEETTAYKSQFPVLFYDVADNVVHSTYLVYNSTEISVMVVDSIDTENSSALETSSQEMADVANDQ